MVCIISLAEVRKGKVRHSDAPDAERAETFRLLAQIRRDIGLPDDYQGKFGVMRREEVEALRRAARPR